MVRWQYWKQLQRFLEGVGHLKHAGFTFVNLFIENGI